MKTCTNCKVERPLHQFLVDKTGLYPDNVTPVCNVCLDQRDADWRQLREEAEPIVNQPIKKDGFDEAMAQASIDYNETLKEINLHYQNTKDLLDARKAEELQAYNERVANVNAEYRDIKAELERSRKVAFETFNRELMQAAEDLRNKRTAIKAEFK